MRIVGNVINCKFAEFMHDPDACIVGAEFDCMESAKGDEAGYELKEGMLYLRVNTRAQRDQLGIGELTIVRTPKLTANSSKAFARWQRSMAVLTFISHSVPASFRIIRIFKWKLFIEQR